MTAIATRKKWNNTSNEHKNSPPPPRVFYNLFQNIQRNVRAVIGQNELIIFP